MKVAGNLMKCLNPLNNFFHCLANGQFTVWPVVVGVSKCAPEPNVAGNLMKCLNPLQNFFHCLANQREEWLGG